MSSPSSGLILHEGMTIFGPVADIGLTTLKPTSVQPVQENSHHTLVSYRNSLMGVIPQDIEQQIDRYASGPEVLRAAIAGLTDSQLRLAVPPGRWSCLEVVCHISDFELVYADRIKRVIAEERPTLFGGDPDQFAARLAYDKRDIEEELSLIESVRHHITRFLRTLDQEAFQREGIHSVDGPISLATLVKRIANHIPHHVEYIHQKRSSL